MRYERTLKNIEEYDYLDIPVSEGFQLIDADGNEAFLARGDSCFRLTIHRFPTREETQHPERCNANGDYFDPEKKELAFRVTSSLGPSTSDHVEFKIAAVETEEFDHTTPAYHQLIVKNTHDYWLTDTFAHNALIAMNVDGKFAEGIRVDVDGVRYHLYFTKERHFFESTGPVTTDTFLTVARTVMICFGLLVGKIDMNEAMVFQYTDDTFHSTERFAYLNNLPRDYASDVVYIEADTRSYFRDDKKHEAIKDEVHPISLESFSRLCTMALNDNDLFRAIHLILEANTASMEARGILYTAILETLSRIIIGGEDLKQASPLPEALGNEMIAKMHAIARGYFGEEYELDGPGKLIRNKIEGLNDASSTGALILPFVKMKIPISGKDKKIIRYRNDYLHGRTPVADAELMVMLQDHLRITYKLGFYIYALLLKYIGHEGKIHNLVVDRARDHGKVQREDPFLDIGKRIEF